MKDINEMTRPKKGYLKEDFLFFHLKDEKNAQFEFHYHDFNKIIVFISGKVTYLVEGKAYRLKPWDILLVSDKEIHKPIIQPGELYERIVIWMNPGFLEKHNNDESNLLSCFELAAANKLNLLRPTPDQLQSLRNVLSQLEEAWKSSEFGSRILKNSLFIQFLVHINRYFLRPDKKVEPNDIEFDEKISRVISYINKNLGNDLSIDCLASIFYMSKYYLMHKFKEQTGCSLHSYITQKRLMLANSLVAQGKPMGEVCAECGFGDYSSFVRAFKKMYGLSPRQHYKNLLRLQDIYDNGPHFYR